ncbi:MAG: hypothetical protein QM706_20030 [Nitrospira sp.]
MLANTRVLGLLAVLLFAAGMVLLGLGLSVAALRLGRILADAFGLLEPDDLRALRLGWETCLFASLIPVVGWIGVFLLASSGMGAVLETLMRRR